MTAVETTIHASFVGGRAGGLSFRIARAPQFIRAVHDRATGRWDVLDLLEDAPGPTETVYVYRRGLLGWACDRGAGASSSGQVATYRPVELTGDEHAQTRDTPSWRQLAADLAQRLDLHG
jgi:hypothetical protein